MNKEMVDFLGRVLRLPWMDQSVKVAIKASRRDFLLLSHLIDRAITTDDAKGYIPAESIEGLKAIATELLSKTDLPDDFAQSFKDISGSKKPV